ncbi:aminotransferase class V-fold PLP-dependent enzyme [Candidatus Peregrinibacteria bacterium]|jgi:cysteine desulfurase|nr:aminotransferase class V-fold PLP-dependent enzyme [Candidatus Peregrinibacteria bacterium]
MNNTVYLDHAATTYVDPKVLEVMLPFFKEEYGNPGSIYKKGRCAKEAVEDSRSTIAKILNCKFDEVFFAGSGTESDNLAILGTMYYLPKFLQKEPKDLHIITNTTEHDAVLQPFKHLEKEGYQVTYLEVDKTGMVDPEAFEKAIRPETVFASVMYANNEIGTIQPLAELTKIAHEHDIIFHTDACQAAGYLDLDTAKLGVDLLTLNGSKVYGPKGIGILYKSKNVKLKPLIYGGGQEKGFRSGTENVPFIVGIAKALEIAEESREKESARLTLLRDKLTNELIKKIPRTYINGHPTNRLPNNINLLILDIEGEALLLYLDEKGIAASTGSACHSKNLDPSHVLLALGLPKDAVHGSIRFTMGKETTEEDIDKVIELMPKIVDQLRDISPIKIDEKKLGL